MLGMAKMIKEWKMVSSTDPLRTEGRQLTWCLDWQTKLEAIPPVELTCGGGWLRCIFPVYHRCIPLGIILEDFLLR